MYSANGKANSTLRLFKSTEGGLSQNIPKDAIHVSEEEHGLFWKEKVYVSKFTDKYLLSEIKALFDALCSEESTVNFGKPITLNGGNVFAEETPASMLHDVDINLFGTYLGGPQLKRPEFKSHYNPHPKSIVDNKTIAGFTVTDPLTETQCRIYEGFIKKPHEVTADDVLALELEICGGVQEVIDSKKNVGQYLIQKPQSYDLSWYWKEYPYVMSLTSE